MKSQLYKAVSYVLLRYLLPNVTYFEILVNFADFHHFPRILKRSQKRGQSKKRLNRPWFTKCRFTYVPCGACNVSTTFRVSQRKPQSIFGHLQHPYNFYSLCFSFIFAKNDVFSAQIDLGCKRLNIRQNFSPLFFQISCKSCHGRSCNSW